MSMAQFDDINDICCEQLEEEEVISELNNPVESSVSSNAQHQSRWWEEAYTEYEQEREKETEYELYYS
jgi:hypothetical protein